MREVSLDAPHREPRCAEKAVGNREKSLVMFFAVLLKKTCLYLIKHDIHAAAANVFKPGLASCFCHNLNPGPAQYDKPCNALLGLKMI